MVRCIAAIDEKRGIATDTGIPWDLPTDRTFFVDQTAEGLIVMGANTYREFTTPMHGRLNYVVTSDTAPLKPGFEAVHDVDAFFREHQGEAINDIGGAGLFASTLKYADELILTQVYADFHCTKFFPEFTAEFELASHGETLDENGTSFRFETWRRRVQKD
jgi:dihydrofolate reductase